MTAPVLTIQLRHCGVPVRAEDIKTTVGKYPITAYLILSDLLVSGKIPAGERLSGRSLFFATVTYLDLPGRFSRKLPARTRDILVEYHYGFVYRSADFVFFHRTA